MKSSFERFIHYSYFTCNDFQDFSKEINYTESTFLEKHGARHTNFFLKGM